MRPPIVQMGADADITLVDRTNHHLFQSLLYQVATAALSPADIATADRALLRRQENVTILMEEVTGVAPGRHIVQLANGRELSYDLTLATGAAYSFIGHEEWRAHARVLKSLRDALAIRAEVLGAFERAEQAESPEEARRLLTFVIVGGGPTGVELAGTLAELARSTLARDFRHIDPRSTRILLCEAGPRVLAAFPESLSGYAADALRTLGVELRLGQSVTAIDATGLMIGDERIETRNVLWCAGTAARPAARWLGVEAARNGAVKVTEIKTKSVTSTRCSPSSGSTDTGVTRISPFCLSIPSSGSSSRWKGRRYWGRSGARYQSGSIPSSTTSSFRGGMALTRPRPREIWIAERGPIPSSSCRRPPAGSPGIPHIRMILSSCRRSG